MNIAIYRSSMAVLTIKIGDTAKLKQALNGTENISISVGSPAVVDIRIGDYITVFGKTYTLNILPNVTKNSQRNYQYDLTFESRLYELGKVQFMNGISADFTLVGNLNFFISQIVANMNRVQTGWTLGTVKAGTDDKNLVFNNENCLEVLQRLCTEYSVDFKITDAKAILADNFVSTAITTVKYGKGNGLGKLSRETVDSKNVFTRLYPYGSTKNLASNYRSYSPRLKIASSYISANEASYGVIEASQTFENIYPRFLGTVTAITDEKTFKCSAIDFNVNSYLISGTTAKIVFNSGQLSGYEFDIVSFDNTLKQFVVKANEQEKIVNTAGVLTSYFIPNATIKPGVGDKFVIVNITMPQSYIDAAETELSNAALAYLNENSTPRVSYKLEVDPIFVKNNSLAFACGDYLHVVDTALGIDKNIQIVALEQGILNPYAYSLDLTDQSVATISRTYADVQDLKRLVVINRLNDPARAQRNWKNVNELQNMIFDTDGYFDSTNIKPLSIETSMLSVGSKSGQFTLSSLIEPNYGGNKAVCKLGTGSLVNFSLESAPRTWALTESNYSSLTDSVPYYIYARCTRATTNTGTLVLDTTKRKVDGDATYYYFLVGVLNSVVNGIRGIMLTYGQTAINGRFVKTGRIQSSDGGTYFDLDSGEISGKVTFLGGSQGYENLSDKPDLTKYEVNLLQFKNVNICPAPIQPFAWDQFALSINGATSENEIIFGTDPYSRQSKLWHCVANGDNAADGGFHSKRIAIDTSKDYRFCVWIKKTGSGTFYQGTESNKVKRLTGAVDSNPYFNISSYLPDGVWCLAVGFIHAYNYSLTTNLSAIYDGRNGSVFQAGTDMKWLDANPQDCFFRTYLWSSAAGTQLHIYAPMVHIIDGTEPTIESLLSVAVSLANSAQSSANTAQSSANSAQTTANTAQALANAAGSAANAAATAAAAAQASATTANTAIADMSSDDKISPIEKSALKKEIDAIASEVTKNDAQADAFAVSRTAYDAAYTALNTYIGTNLSVLTTTWDLGASGGVTLRSKFKAYTDARTDLLNVISDKAKSIADSKALNFTSQPVTPYKLGDTWVDGTDMYSCVTSRASGVFVALDWTKRTKYDSTQTVIDGGLVTAGSFRVKDANGAEWGGMRGATGTDGSEIGLWLGASFANRANANLYARHDGYLFTKFGNIAGWSINDGYLAKDTGVAATSAGMSPADFPFYAGATYANKGAAPFRVLPSGEMYCAKATIKTGTTGKRMEISAADNNLTFYSTTDTNFVRIDDTTVANRAGIRIEYITDALYAIGGYLNIYSAPGGLLKNNFSVDARGSGRMDMIMKNLPFTSEVVGGTAGGHFLGVTPGGTVFLVE